MIISSTSMILICHGNWAWESQCPVSTDHSALIGVQSFQFLICSLGDGMVQLLCLQLPVLITNPTFLCTFWQFPNGLALPHVDIRTGALYP
jgi:hypothetical protein